jgi:nitrite reductase/ring-hydroxylating ferredoxin subunit
LDWTPDRFLSADGSMLICATHGALFEIATGVCVSGPCQGDQLTQVEFSIRDGMVLIAPG